MEFQLSADDIRQMRQHLETTRRDRIPSVTEQTCVCYGGPLDLLCLDVAGTAESGTIVAWYHQLGDRTVLLHYELRADGTLHYRDTVVT